MTCPLPAAQLKNLKSFIDLCRREPSILYTSELGFFKTYIESLGGVIPPDNKKGQNKDEEPTIKQVEEEMEEVDSGESDIELDFDGVIEPDTEEPQVMGSYDKEVSEEDIEKSDEKKREAFVFYTQQKYEDAIKACTEAILLNPKSAALYAKRGQCYLQLKKPNACIRDCNEALKINPDSAAAYKFRGRAHRLLGNFLKAAEDLRVACKIDFDEQADEWLKEVTPNAKKIEEHQRKYERKRLEKDLKETRDRISKMKEEQQKKGNEAKGEFEGESGGAPWMADIPKFLKDPEIMAAFQDPEIVEAFTDASRYLPNILKYQNNPKVMAILQKLSAMSNGKIPGGLGEVAAALRGFGGGVPPFGGTGPAQDDTKSQPKSTADIDLD